MSRTDRISLWFTRHYMLLINLFVGVYLGLSFAAPALQAAGWTFPASMLYRAYGLTCHQLSYRSWFINGPQPYYPLRAAGLEGVLPYDEIVAPNKVDIWTAKAWLGDQAHGFKVALCERDVAIYGSMFLFGVIYALSRRNLAPVSWKVWILIGLVPIGLDGFSQMFGMIPLDFLHRYLPVRESTPLLRTITGALFGLTTAWFAYPLVELTMRDTREILAYKYGTQMDHFKTSQTPYDQQKNP